MLWICNKYRAGVIFHVFLVSLILWIFMSCFSISICLAINFTYWIFRSNDSQRFYSRRENEYNLSLASDLRTIFIIWTWKMNIGAKVIKRIRIAKRIPKDWYAFSSKMIYYSPSRWIIYRYFSHVTKYADELFRNGIYANKRFKYLFIKSPTWSELIVHVWRELFN